MEGYEVKLVNGNVTIIGKNTDPVMLKNIKDLEKPEPNCGNLITETEKEGLFGVLIDEKEVPTTTFSLNSHSCFAHKESSIFEVTSLM